jgi:hypothetical protein
VPVLVLVLVLIPSQDFYPWVQSVMVEKIRALRNSFSSGSKQAAPASQPAYGGSQRTSNLASSHSCSPAKLGWLASEPGIQCLGEESALTTFSSDPSRGARKAKSTNPIIMISSSPTSLITMWNVKKFLEQGM